MNKVNIVVQTADKYSWAFTVTESRYGVFMQTLRTGEWASLTKTDYAGNTTEHTFNPRHVVSVSITPLN